MGLLNFLSLSVLPVPILTAFYNTNRGLFTEVQLNLFPCKEGLSMNYYSCWVSQLGLLR